MNSTITRIMSAFECDENTAILIDSVAKADYKPELYDDRSQTPLERIFEGYHRFPKYPIIPSAQLLLKAEPKHNGKL